MNAQGEIWRDIPDYEETYQVSSFGRVRRKSSNHILAPARHQRISNGKYDYVIKLWRNGSYKRFLVSRLVCASFYGVPDGEMTANHKDGNTENNHLDNLEWLSRSENIRHGHENGLFPSQRRFTRLTKLSDETSQVYQSMADASRAIGRNRLYISLCSQNDWNAVGIDGEKYQIHSEECKCKCLEG